MQHLIPAILYIAYVQAYAQISPQLHSTYGSYNSPLTFANDRAQYLPPSSQYAPIAYPNAYPATATNNYEAFRSVPYFKDADYYKLKSTPYGQYLRTSNLREPQPAKSNLYPGPEVYTFDLDYASNVQAEDSLPELDPVPESKGAANTDETSYYEDLELIENFANYLRRRTQLDASSTSVADPARQYNALLAVLVALARAIRNTCSDADQLYDQIYLPTVETYYKYGLANADKVAALIEDYIERGNAHIPKIRKLKQDLCEKELFCPTAVENKIKNSPLIYVKELETLESIAHLARSYYPYMEEFNQAAQQNSVLAYLQKSKDRVKDYIMSVVNSVDHLSDKTVRCKK